MIQTAIVRETDQVGGIDTNLFLGNEPTCNVIHLGYNRLRDTELLR